MFIPPVSSKFLTVEELKGYLKTPANSTRVTYDDTALATTIGNAVAVAVAYLGYDPSLTTYTETYVIPGPTRSLVLAHSPVVSLVSLSLNGATPDLDGVFLDDEAGTLDFNFPMPYSGYRLDAVYQAGFDPIPADIRDAIAKLAMWDRARVLSGDFGVRSRMVGDSTTSYEVDIPVNIKNQLNRYIQRRPFAIRPTSALSFTKP